MNRLLIIVQGCNCCITLTSNICLMYFRDMDFNLDGDFNKLSSFKVDMSDLDFSCPPRKTTKPKERSEEESSGGNRPGRKDIDFCFDFNE